MVQAMDGEGGPDRFFAAFAGPYTVGRSRSDAQARTTFISGGGNSSAFLHGDLLLTIETPSDPSSGPTGKASLFVKNYAETSSVLFLDLEGDPEDARNGRPKRFTWSVGDESSGAFSGAEGEGTLDIRYQPGGKRPPRAIDAGRAGVKFFGQVHVDKVANPLNVR